MSIVKVAVEQIDKDFGDSNRPIVVVNQAPGSSKTLSKQNVAAAAAGGTTGFLANEMVKKIPRYSDASFLHRYGRRMSTVLFGLGGAAGAYSLMNKNKNNNTIYMV